VITKRQPVESPDGDTPALTFNGVKVFSATMLANRARLGDEVSEWIAAHPACLIKDVVVTQSSDSAFHCIAISVFYAEQLAAP
jgi:hypothetical protein